MYVNKAQTLCVLLLTHTVFANLTPWTPSHELGETPEHESRRRLGKYDHMTDEEKCRNCKGDQNASSMFDFLSSGFSGTHVCKDPDNNTAVWLWPEACLNPYALGLYNARIAGTGNLGSNQQGHGAGNPGCVKLGFVVDSEMVSKAGGTLESTRAYLETLVNWVSDKIYKPMLNIDLRLGDVWNHDHESHMANSCDMNCILDSTMKKFNGDYKSKADTHQIIVAATGRKLGGGVAFLHGLYQPYGNQMARTSYCVLGDMEGSTKETGEFDMSQQKYKRVSCDINDAKCARWDKLVLAHEVGHLFGAPHTHDEGIDTCARDCKVPSGGGTIMSYCHTCRGRFDNIKNIFHTQIKAKIDADLQKYAIPGTQCVLGPTPPPTTPPPTPPTPLPTPSPTFPIDQNKITLGASSTVCQANAILPNKERCRAFAQNGIYWAEGPKVIAANMQCADTYLTVGGDVSLTRCANMATQYGGGNAFMYRTATNGRRRLQYYPSYTSSLSSYSSSSSGTTFSGFNMDDFMNGGTTGTGGGTTTTSGGTTTTTSGGTTTTTSGGTTTTTSSGGTTVTSSGTNGGFGGGQFGDLSKCATCRGSGTKAASETGWNVYSGSETSVEQRQGSFRTTSSFEITNSNYPSGCFATGQEVDDRTTVIGGSFEYEHLYVYWNHGGGRAHGIAQPVCYSTDSNGNGGPPPTPAPVHSSTPSPTMPGTIPTLRPTTGGSSSNGECDSAAKEKLRQLTAQVEQVLQELRALAN